MTDSGRALRIPAEVWDRAVDAALAEYRTRPGIIPRNKIPRLLLEEKLRKDVETVLHAALPVLLAEKARTGYWEIINGDADRRWAFEVEEETEAGGR